MIDVDRDHVKGFAQPLLRRSQPYSGPLERSGQVVVTELHGPVGDLLHLIARVLGPGEVNGQPGVVQSQRDLLLTHPPSVPDRAGRASSGSPDWEQ